MMVNYCIRILVTGGKTGKYREVDEFEKVISLPGFLPIGYKINFPGISLSVESPFVEEDGTVCLFFRWKNNGELQRQLLNAGFTRISIGIGTDSDIHLPK